MSPIPVHTNFYLAQVCIPNDDAPSVPAFINTLYFEDLVPEADPNDVADTIQAALDAAYNTVTSPGTARPNSLFSGIISNADVFYKVYNLGEAAPRTPMTRAATWGTPSGVTSLPNECAAVLSFHGGPTTAGGGTLDKRKRGRIYLGPLASNTIVTDGTDARLTSTTMANFAGLANSLFAETAIDWMQYSRVADEFSIVTQAFVDNAFDTQRRRGEGATSRLIVP